MADLMFPLIFVAIMLIVIECIESPLFLELIGIMWMPIGLLFLSSGDYTTLFQASITYSDYVRWMFGGILSCVSIAAFMRMIFIKRQLASEAVKSQ